MLVLGIGWIDGKFLIDLLPVALLQESIGRPQILNGFELEFFDEPVLIGAVATFHAAFGLRRSGVDQFNAQLAASLTKGRQRFLPLELFFQSGFPIRAKDGLVIDIQGLRDSVTPDPAPQGRIAASVVSCSNSSPNRRPVASSTIFIRPVFAHPTRRDDCRPSAPTLQNASVALAADGGARAVVVAATALLPAANAAASRDPTPVPPRLISHSQTSARTPHSAAGIALESDLVALPRSSDSILARGSDGSVPGLLAAGSVDTLDDTAGS